MNTGTTARFLFHTGEATRVEAGHANPHLFGGSAVARSARPWQTTASPTPLTVRTAPLALTISTAGLSDLGRRRERNEDALLLDPGSGLLVVADGMGGHPDGHVASALAVAEVVRRLPPPGSAPSLGAWMAEAVRGADARVRSGPGRGEGSAGMGTTLTVLLTRPDDGRLVVGHVGDSRAYVLEGDRLRQLTRDDSWVERQVAMGLLTPGQARVHPRANLLTQSLGVGDPVVPQVIERALLPGELYLLCTDGLTHMLPDVAIERLLADALPSGLEAAARALVDAANDRGGIDNVTVALLRVTTESGA